MLGYQTKWDGSGSISSVSPSQHVLCSISKTFGFGNVGNCTRQGSLLEGAGFFHVSSLDVILVRRCVSPACGLGVPGEVHVVPGTPLICLVIRPSAKWCGPNGVDQMVWTKWLGPNLVTNWKNLLTNLENLLSKWRICGPNGNQTGDQMEKSADQMVHLLSKWPFADQIC